MVSAKTKYPVEDSMDRYIIDVIARGELYLEIERVRQLLVRLNQTPKKNQDDIHHAERVFKALLKAKEARTQNTNENNQ